MARTERTVLSRPLRFAFTIGGGYLVLATGWILLSDHLVPLAVEDPDRLTQLQTIKGWGFVMVTSLLLAALVYNRVRALERSNQALTATYANLQALIEAAPVPIAALDQQGRVQVWNPAAERLFGWRAHEVHGRANPTVFDADVEAAQHVRQRVLAGECITGMAVRRKRRDGQIVEINLAMAPLQNDRGITTGIVVIMIDITGQNRAERLMRERDTLRQSTRAMDQVLGVVGHELRTPLAGLRAMAEYLLTDGARDTVEATSFIQAIHQKVLRMTEMVNNMLEGARLNSGIAQWNWTNVPLRHVCQEALDIVQPLIDRDKVHLHCQIEPADLAMFGDADAIRRLVLNLLTNAHKHTPQGSIRIVAREQRDTEQRWIELRVEDTGRGIPPEVAQKLGRAFALNRGTVGEQYVKGAGLGLAICRGIVAAHGGRIWVASVRGQGTVFKVLLRADLPGPVAPSEEMPIISEVAA